MIYDILTGIAMIASGVFLVAFMLVSMAFLECIGLETQREIMAEEYQERYDELKSETELNQLNEQA